MVKCRYTERADGKKKEKENMKHISGYVCTPPCQCLRWLSSGTAIESPPKFKDALVPLMSQILPTNDITKNKHAKKTCIPEPRVLAGPPTTHPRGRTPGHIRQVPAAQSLARGLQPCCVNI